MSHSYKNEEVDYAGQMYKGKSSRSHTLTLYRIALESCRIEVPTDQIFTVNGETPKKASKIKKGDVLNLIWNGEKKTQVVIEIDEVSRDCFSASEVKNGVIVINT